MKKLLFAMLTGLALAVGCQAAPVEPVELTYQQMPEELKAGLWFVVDGRVVGIKLEQERGAYGRLFLGNKVDELIGTPKVIDENGWAISHSYGRACKRVGQVVVVLHLRGDEWTDELRLAFVKGFGNSFESTLALYNVKMK